jgi:hypothetical protein
LLSGPKRAKKRDHVEGLTFGELGLVAFIVAAILSAKLWPRMGEWVALRLSRGRSDGSER